MTVLMLSCTTLAALLAWAITRWQLEAERHRTAELEAKLWAMTNDSRFNKQRLHNMQEGEQA